MTAQRGATKKKDEPFDLDAARAARREAMGDGFAFVFGGQTFTCTPTKEWPVAVLASLSDGDLTGALELILGDEQYQRFMEQQPTSGDVQDLMEALGKDAGVGGAGN